MPQESGEEEGVVKVAGGGREACGVAGTLGEREGEAPGEREGEGVGAREALGEAEA